ncbi:hypothetical protein [Shouchella clausii]|uniref:hypothetical protein n=1 Tax=Shouchella TaxID=2893057 RepID=UPI001C739E98|nr:hypothetical protein [Shouchella clausii]MBX0319503.1 hypothetical protein [Shouchella clausii]MDO7266596.1 hypothetical protein [Shouchella clausii]MDO7286489.1 hypothetical protein [Shouchella clausii]
MTWHNQDPLNLSKEEWINLLQDEKVFNKIGLEMVFFVYKQPNYQSNATEIGEALGGVSQQQVTAWNRSIAKKIYQKLQKEPPFNSRGGKRYWNVLFDGAVERELDDKGNFIWKLRPSLVSALKRLGTSDNKTAKIES